MDEKQDMICPTINDEEIDAIDSYLKVPEWLKFPDALATTQSWPFDRVEKKVETQIMIK